MPFASRTKGTAGLLMAICVALAAGCAGKKPVTPPPPLAVYVLQDAIFNGTLALADFRRERVLAESENRQANYTAARTELAAAVEILKPSKESIHATEYEEPATCLEAALLAVDNIMSAQAQQETAAEMAGWDAFDQSVEALLLALEPLASDEAKAPISAIPGSTAATSGSDDSVFSANGFFTIIPPKGWSKVEEGFGLSQEEKKVFGGDFIGPAAEGFMVSMSAHYYAPGNLLDDTPEDYIRLHAQPALGVNLDGDVYSEVTTGKVGDRSAWFFDRTGYEYLERNALHPKKVAVYEKFVVMPAAEGFYALKFSAPASVAQDHLPAFEAALETFKPQVGPRPAQETEVTADAEPAAQIDPSRSGVYQSDQWEYRYTITGEGSRSEGRRGELLFDGANVDEPAAPGDYHETPWGNIYWAGDSELPWGDHGWMPSDSAIIVIPGSSAPANGAPVVMAMILSNAEAGTGAAEVDEWVKEQMTALNVENFSVLQEWFPLGNQAVTIHDSKMLGILKARLLPARDAAKLTVLLDGQYPQFIDLKREDGGKSFASYPMNGILEAKTFYLAFQVKHAAPQWLMPVDIGLDSNGNVLAVSGAREVVIGLPGEEISGCEWIVTSIVDDSPQVDCLRLEGGPQFTPALEVAEDAPRSGTFENIFSVQGNGRAEVTLEYRRPWQTEEPAEQTFTVTLEVHSQK